MSKNGKRDVKPVDTEIKKANSIPVERGIGKAKNGHIAHTPPPKPVKVPKK